MLTYDGIVLGTALAIDACVATFALGVLTVHQSLRVKTMGAFYLAALFGIFQFFMLWLGSIGGYHFSFSKFGHLFQLIIIATFLIIGSKIIIDSFAAVERKLTWGFGPTLLMAIATSIDALASGVSLGTMPSAWTIALEVGAITFALSLLFFIFSQITTSLPEKWLQRFAGGIFLGLGVKVLLDYMRLGGLL